MGFDGMNVCIIHGSPRRGNTWQALAIVRAELRRLGMQKCEEYHVPRDLAAFCRGCYACFDRGEEYCPNAAQVQPIVKSLLAADALVFTSPAYVIGPSAAMKNFLDHTAYLFMAHRPDPRMFSKPALLLATAAGHGAKQANAGMAACLKHWGIPKVLRANIRILAEDWDHMPQRKKDNLTVQLHSLARRLERATRRSPRPPLFTRGLFFVMKQLMKQYPNGHFDKEYWRRQGWLS